MIFDKMNKSLKFEQVYADTDNSMVSVSVFGFFRRYRWFFVYIYSEALYEKKNYMDVHTCFIS